MAKNVIFKMVTATILAFASKTSYGTPFSVSVSNLVRIRSKMAELLPFN